MSPKRIGIGTGIGLGITLFAISLGGCNKQRESQNKGQAESPTSPLLPSPPPFDRAAQNRAMIPSGQAQDILRTRCEICHSIDYVTQQRLSAAQWDKVLTKMQTWGAILSDEEKRQLGPFLASTLAAE